MRVLFTLMLAGIFSLSWAGPNDTTRVTAMQDVDMTWYGAYDREALLPDGSKSYRQILMHYTMGCASNGCSDWDYTTKIELMDETGVIDSVLRQAPNFKVNGGTRDSLIFSWDTTYTTMQVPGGTDSTANAALEVILYEDAVDPLLPTDTIYVWQAGYLNFYYDSLGNFDGSRYVPEDSIAFTQYTPYYHYFEVVNRIELGRVITPYGGYMAQGSNGFNNNWKHTSTFDVTDYAHFLRDSIKLRAFYSGWSSGFSATIEFEFIEGTPSRDVIALENIYKGYYNYNNTADFENNQMPAKKVFFPNNAASSKARVVPTGHGFDNNTSCAEFCEKEYYIYMDGNLAAAELMWDDQCGENPIYPQGGTWVYDRANWCPGTAARIFEHDLTGFYTPGDTVDFDFDIEAFTWVGAQAPGYEMSVQLVHYGPDNFSNDAAIVDVKRPNDKDAYGRMNPTCNQPVIIIKNEAMSSPLTSAEIVYGLQNGTQYTYNWTGFIAKGNELEVALPEIPFPQGWVGDDVFLVSLNNPNGTADDNDLNNSYKTKFKRAKSLPNHLVFEVKTNNRGSENAWKLVDPYGNTVYSRASPSSNTTYKDTVYLPYGCYYFELIDYDEDGLSWWANNDGSGYARIREVGSSVVHSFKADFGSFQKLEFTTGNDISIEEDLFSAFDMYPNPATDVVQLDVQLKQQSDLTVELFNMQGQRVFHKLLKNQKQLNEQLDVKMLQSGTYSLRISSKDGSFAKPLIIQ